MWDILKKLFGTPEYISAMDTTPDGPDPEPDDIWAFTDPDARASYEARGELESLEQDLRFEVMRAESWSDAEMSYKRELRRLLQEGLITDKGTYWFASPFATVYRATASGTLTVEGKHHAFEKDDDIVFQCRMTREKNGTRDVLLVARLQQATKAVLCSEMKSAMKGGGMGGM